MPRFHFQLEAVLEQRRAVERTKQLEVAGLERRKLDLEERVREIQRQIVSEKQDLREALTAAGGGAGVDLRHVRLQAGASLRLVGKAQHAVVQLAGIHSRLEACRAELVAATTRRKAVEVLKERRLEEWKHEERRRENSAMDELSVMHAARTEDRL